MTRLSTAHSSLLRLLDVIAAVPHGGPIGITERELSRLRINNLAERSVCGVAGEYVLGRRLVVIPDDWAEFLLAWWTWPRISVPAGCTEILVEPGVSLHRIALA